MIRMPFIIIFTALHNNSSRSTRRSLNAGVMSWHLLQRWLNIVPLLGHNHVITVVFVHLNLITLLYDKEYCLLGKHHKLAQCQQNVELIFVTIAKHIRFNVVSNKRNMLYLVEAGLMLLFCVTYIFCNTEH